MAIPQIVMHQPQNKYKIFYLHLFSSKNYERFYSFVSSASPL